MPTFVVMFRRESIKKPFSLFLAMLYLAMVFLAQNFHNHGSGEVYKDFNFKNSKQTISASSLQKQNVDCLSCHLMFEGFSTAPAAYNLNFDYFQYFQKTETAYFQRFSKVQIHDFYLRGPPSFFI